MFINIGRPAPRTNENCLKSGFKQVVDRESLTDYRIGFNLYAELLQPFDFLRNNGLGQTEFGNAIHKHAAGSVKRLKNRHIISELRQIAGAGKGRPGRNR